MFASSFISKECKHYIHIKRGLLTLPFYDQRQCEKPQKVERHQVQNPTLSLCIYANERMTEAINNVEFMKKLTMCQEDVSIAIERELKSQYRTLRLFPAVRLESIEDVSITVDRAYNGAGEYKFNGPAKLGILQEGGILCQLYSISGRANIREVDGSPTVELVDVIMISKR